MKAINLATLLLTFIGYNTYAQEACVIKMVFKQGAKQPLIAQAPNNEGIFKDLYSEAARRIGCKISISRLPKQRLHLGLEHGQFDFYPAASFSPKRAEYLYYIDNGILTAEYGVSDSRLPEITQLSNLREHSNLIWLMENNSSKQETASLYGITTQKVAYLNINKLLEFTTTRPKFNYFYVADKEVIDAFLARNKNKTLADYGLKKHKTCCGKEQPMYIAFSRQSPHLQEEPNAIYNNQVRITANNQPISLSIDSVAYQLGQALQEMKYEGVTEEIFNRWYRVKK